MIHKRFTTLHLMMNICIFFVGICVYCITDVLSNGSIPEQIHISYGDIPSSMVIMWSSRDRGDYNVTYWTTRDSYVYSTGSDAVRLPKVAAKAVPYIHRAVLKNLKEGTQYFYKISPAVSDNSTLQFESETVSFTTLGKYQKYPYKFLVYGDMGSSGSIPTYAVLERLVDSGNFTAIWHVGDMAYDLNKDLGTVGDVFFNNIQPFASRVPYMPSPGNHELYDDFIHYRIRFSTPNTPWPIPIDQMWYSYNVGPIHFISYSTEVYFTYNEFYVCKQFNWLLLDLLEANRNRDKQPWVIAIGHRPLYCSNNNIDDCTHRLFGGWVEYGLEDLFYAQGVDLIIQAHEHSYERLFPVYKRKVYGQDYVNPRAPVQIISGAAGSLEGVNSMTKGKSEWSAFKADKKSRFTFGQLEIHNSTHLYFEQREAAVNGTLDSFWLVQNNHGPFVANLSCAGENIHHSCSCPPPILYIYYFVWAALGGVALLALALYILYRYLWKVRRRRKYDDKGFAKFTQLTDKNEHEGLLKEYG